MAATDDPVVRLLGQARAELATGGSAWGRPLLQAATTLLIRGDSVGRTHCTDLVQMAERGQGRIAAWIIGEALNNWRRRTGRPEVDYGIGI